MFLSEKTKEYCKGINATRQAAGRRILVITCLIAILPPIAKAIVQQSFNIKDCLTAANIIYIIITVLLFRYLYTSIDTKEKLDVDQLYYDNEIIALREKSIECLKQSNLLGMYNVAIFQISQIGKALDFTLMHYRKIAESSILNIREVFEIIDSIMNSVYSIILKEYYQGYQEKLNFALYYYSPKYKKYFDMISYKPETNKNKKGRIWDENDNSHICFVGRQKSCISIIYDNINERLPLPENAKESDRYNYVSSISVPIKLSNSEHCNFILSLTSNFKNRFNDDTDDEVINKINGLFSAFIINIATIIEIALEKNIKNKDNEIEQLVLEDYAKTRNEELIKHGLDRILSDLS